jgi:hypothetical protein
VQPWAWCFLALVLAALLTLWTLVYVALVLFDELFDRAQREGDELGVADQLELFDARARHPAGREWDGNPSR